MGSRVFMSFRRSHVIRCLACVLLVALPWAQLSAGFRSFGGSAVGGVSISVEGVVRTSSQDARQRLLQELRKTVKNPEGEINTPVALRMVSLKALDAACAEALKANSGPLPDEIRYLAGLQRIQYVFVYPEQNDIVLAGPGEGWKVDESANVVGITTGRPVMQLDDLLVALRSVEEARQGGISVSIDPTEEGTRRLNELLAQQRGLKRMTPQLESLMKEAFGPQQVTIRGVPPTSHFARVLTAADYRMKRIAMKLDASPIRDLPSYLDVIKNQRARAIASARPRWWLACNYEPLGTSDDGLAWELRGPGVKAMTEDEIVSSDGTREKTGKTSPAAEKWANLMTEKYDSLSKADAVFGELRNLMDMCVVAALIQKEHLAEKANLKIPTLTESSSALKVDDGWNAPRTITPEISWLQGSDAFIVTASGGVSVESWAVADRKTVAQEVSQLRDKAKPGDQPRLWW